MTTPVEPHQPPERWTPSLDSFGTRLAVVRQKMGWNVKEAAIACGLPPENWRRWEQTGLEPRRMVTIAMAIATRTRVDLDWLVYGPDGKAANPQPTGEQLTRWYARDPLAPRAVRHGDDRRRPRDSRPSTRTGRNPSPSRHRERTVSLPAPA